MPPPVIITLVYLAINMALMVWLVAEEASGRTPPVWLTVLSTSTRYGPPLIGLVYLVALGGDWAFFFFVVIFFAVSFWLLDGLLNYPSRPPKRR